MVTIPYLHRINLEELDWEQNGRALIEYCGIPLALFMAIGIVVSFLRGYGMYSPLFDPIENYKAYFVVNVWIVGGIYAYRQRYQPSLLLEDKKELVLAGIVAFTWVLTQPLLLLIGYGFYIIAVMRQDELHGSFLPDLTDVDPDEPESQDKDPEAWGHLESVKDNMT